MREGLKDLSVLVVAREEPTRNTILKVLRGENLRVEGAESGAFALERLAQVPFQLVLADVNLPDMTAGQLIGRIRDLAAGTQTVALARAGETAAAHAAEREGAYDTIQIPVDDHADLVAAVHRASEFIRLQNENRRLIAELTVKNTELTRQNAELYALAQWGRRLADSIELRDLYRSAVEGLSALTGGRPAALFAAPMKKARFQRVALHPSITVPKNPELGIARSELPADVAGFSRALEEGKIREALLGHFGQQPRAVYPMIIGDESHGFLVSVNTENPGPEISDSGLAQYVSHVASAVANAVLVSRLAENTLRDKLTGLYTRRYMDDRLTEEISRSQRSGEPMSLLIIDVDHFAKLNEIHGRHTGDQVLVGIADILRGDPHSHAVVVRNRLTDIPVRVDGNRLAIILPMTDKKGARIKAENVRAAVETSPLPGRETQPGGKVTVSCGIATYPEDAGDPSNLLEMATRAARTAQDAGRNRVVVTGDPKSSHPQGAGA